MSNTDIHLTCIMDTCDTHKPIAMSLYMVIILTLNMLIFAWLNSCFDHGDHNYNMLVCLFYYYTCTIEPIALGNPVIIPIDIGTHNKVSCGCIFNTCTVQKDHEKFNLLVLNQKICQTIGYLFINNNPMLNLTKNSSFSAYFGIFYLKNIKNHGLFGLTLKTEVFMPIFLRDPVLKMSTKSCARILITCAFSGMKHHQKTALKNTFFECDNQNFFKIQKTHLLYFITRHQTPFLIDSLCRSTSISKTMYFLTSDRYGPRDDHDKLDLDNIHVFLAIQPYTKPHYGQY